MTKRILVGAIALALLTSTSPGCGGGIGNDVDSGLPPPPKCTAGTDKDGDQYGEGCPAGPDCDDNDSTTYPGAKEACDNKDNDCDGEVDEGAKNACGTCDPNCNSFGAGSGPFPIDPAKDPKLKDANGVKLDPQGDLVLDKAAVNFNYLWIANTYDMGSEVCAKAATGVPGCRGTISKVDTVSMKEVARYFSVTCSAKTGPTGCADVNGLPITLNHNHTPSRTAVDYNFDCWVANRNVHGGQPSATKLANDPNDCIDRNKNGVIDTSKDQDGDGKINADCNGDGVFDSAATVCSNGKPPEFLGDDDECVLFTVNYAEPDAIGRSICLDTGKNNVGASNAWVGTWNRPYLGLGNNRFYMINGNTGKIEATVDLPVDPGGDPAKAHHSYGSMADAHHVIWSTDLLGSLTYFKSVAPHDVGPLMRSPWFPKPGANYHQYGISINADQHVWLGGYDTYWVYRYKPERSTFAGLGKGVWTRFKLPDGFVTRGIAADARGKVWVAIQNGGYLFRIDQNMPDGDHDLTGAKTYYKLTANVVIGAGVDFNGNVWGVGHGNDTASRIDVDASGNVTSSASKDVMIGRNPYTYSDFTGYGLMNFVRPQGRYVYEHSACEGGKVTWSGVSWKATTPAGTSVSLRVRTGDSDATFGPWSQEFTATPASFGPVSKQPITPNPSLFMQVEFTLKTQNKDATPILHDYAISFSCGGPPE